MSELNLSELKFTEIDIKNFVNSSLDVEEGSVLFVNHDDKDMALIHICRCRR